MIIKRKDDKNVNVHDKVIETLELYSDSPLWVQMNAVLHFVLTQVGPSETLKRIPEISQITHFQLSDLYNVLLLYMGLHKEEFTSKHTVHICTGLGCRLKGASPVNTSVSKWLDVDVGHATIDKHFYLKGHSCMRQCQKAPFVRVNQDVYDQIRPSDVQRILSAYLGHSHGPKAIGSIARHGVHSPNTEDSGA